MVSQNSAGEQAGEAQQQDSVSRRRAQLIAAKNIEVRNQPRVGAVGRTSLKDRLDQELERFLKWRGTVSVDENPNGWWRKNHEDYPLLAKFWMAHSSFPATSTSAERVFNMDGLILVPRRLVVTSSLFYSVSFFFYRMSLDPGRTANMVVALESPGELFAVWEVP